MRNGLKIQWLKVNGVSSPVSDYSVNLPISYNAFYVPVLGLNVTTNDTDNLQWRHIGMDNSNLATIKLARMTAESRFIITIGY